jgi:hypothetical protein
MPDLACDLFENAICLSRFIELEKVSTSAVGKKKRFNDIGRRSNLISFPFSLFIFGGCPNPAITFAVCWH